jgi:hypothetical protein
MYYVESILYSITLIFYIKIMQHTIVIMKYFIHEKEINIITKQILFYGYIQPTL